MSQNFQPGDFLVFQLEAGFGLLRFIANSELDGQQTWNVAAYRDFFPDVETAEAASLMSELELANPHIALTQRAFESTQVAKIANRPLTVPELEAFERWRNSSESTVSDRSVRLMLGFR